VENSPPNIRGYTRIVYSVYIGTVHGRLDVPVTWIVRDVIRALFACFPLAVAGGQRGRAGIPREQFPRIADVTRMSDVSRGRAA